MEAKATRVGYGEMILELGRQNKNIVVLSADVTASTNSHLFAKEFPNRFFNIGISEQDMICEAAGLSLVGKISFVSAYAIFATGRTWDQIRNTICYCDLNVKIIGTHSGLMVGPDGATHQALEDIAITRAIPNLKVISPCDYLETKKAVKAIVHDFGPTYLRLGREKTPIITEENTPFKIGKANILRDGIDVTIFATGVMVSEALKAAEILEHENLSLRVVNVHTIKPLDKNTIIKCAKETGAIVTAEEHQIVGGLGSAIAETLGMNYPVPIEMVGMKDSFGESGEPFELLKYYGLSDIEIIKAVKNVLLRKKF
ncbi:MAG: transketolase family protein [Elusimicrobiota bacterium]|nr:transketolase family protein [Elusimicrobiota bacterium]